MKLFKRLMTALLAGVLAMGMLAGCSGAPAAPNTPLPNDAEALALYQGVSETCKKYNVKTPVYCAELEPHRAGDCQGGCDSPVLHHATVCCCDQQG